MSRSEGRGASKRDGQSFSDVIKEHFGGRTTGSVLARVVADLALDESTLDEFDRVIEARAEDTARAPDL